mmetsp:Transcript_118801/g.343568  ORF Transcript_118801/g.343568 Transcript_118801/m.343568 type:complete len:245 (+) Transcript_118801:291-1025(+)
MSSSSRTGRPASSKTKQCMPISRVSAGEPPSTCCTKTPLPGPRESNILAAATPQRSRMHRGVRLSTRPAHKSNCSSSAEGKRDRGTTTSRSLPSRKTLTVMSPLGPLGHELAAAEAGRRRTFRAVAAAEAPAGRSARARSMSRQQVMGCPPIPMSTSPGWRRPSEAPVGITRCTHIARAAWPERPHRCAIACNQDLGNCPCAPRASVATSTAVTSTSKDGASSLASGSARNRSTMGRKTSATTP